MKKIWLFILPVFLPLACLGFSILPSRFVLTVDPGESQNIKIEIKNDSDSEKKYSLKIVGLSQDNGGNVVMKEKSDIAEYWIMHEDRDFSVEAKSSRKIPLVVAVPKGTAPGSHFVGVGVSEKTGESVAAELVAVVKIAVAGQVTENLEIKNFSPFKKVFFSNNWKFDASFKNKGNIDVDTKGLLQVSDFFDRDIYQSEAKIGSVFFSQSERYVSLTARSDKKFLLPGVYHAYLRIDYGLTNQSLAMETDFWYLPTWSLGLLVLIVGLFVWKKFLNKKLIFKNE